jgi:hypothetical protein
MVETGRELPPATRQRVAETWRKEKRFTSARNAVEHIRGDVPTTNQFMNWASSRGTVTAAVTPGAIAGVSEAALLRLLNCRG